MILPDIKDLGRRAFASVRPRPLADKEDSPRSAMKSLRKKSTFLSETSIPGISHANVRTISGGGNFRRVVWLAFFLCGVMLTVIQVSRVVDDYLRYPVSTTVTVEDDGDLPFPAVTVCPVNRIKCSSLITVLQQCLAEEGSASATCTQDKWFSYCEIGFHAGCFRWMLRDATLSGENKTAVKEFLNSACPNHDADAVSWESLDAEITSMRETALNQEYSNLSPEDRTAIGMRADEMVKLCLVSDSRPCSDYFNVTIMNTVTRGNCFIFNSEGQMGEMLAGPRSGIAIDLALSRHEYPWRPTNDLEGVRVVLHGPDEIPLPEENGMDLLPGTASRVAVERSVLHRREYPYPSRCVRDWSETGLGRMVGASVGDADYVQATCNRMCLLHFVIVDCDCIWHQYDDLNMREFKRKVQHTPTWYCGFSNQTQQRCITYVTKNYDRDRCDCRPSCEDVTFKPASVSSLRWPSEASWAYKAHQYGVKYMKMPITVEQLKLEEDERFLVASSVRSDMLRVEIFLANTKQTVVKEEPIFPDVYSLFTSLGGAMSVWMGVSFIMMLEVVELLVDLIKGACLYQSGGAGTGGGIASRRESKL